MGQHGAVLQMACEGRHNHTVQGGAWPAEHASRLQAAAGRRHKLGTRRYFVAIAIHLACVQ
jgi:hypothetical protein